MLLLAELSSIALINHLGDVLFISAPCTLVAICQLEFLYEYMDEYGNCQPNRVGVVSYALTVSLSISNTFIPGPLSSIILEMYCFTARITFIVTEKN